MGTVLDAVREEVEKTIHALDQKRFDPDPIAGPHFSKITSVMSSAYKRHGYILERAILEALRTCLDFEVWRDEAFKSRRPSITSWTGRFWSQQTSLGRTTILNRGTDAAS